MEWAWFWVCRILSPFGVCKGACRRESLTIIVEVWGICSKYYLAIHQFVILIKLAAAVSFARDHRRAGLVTL